MIIKILGSGCKKCVTLNENTHQALSNLGLQAEVLKVTDFAQCDHVATLYRTDTLRRRPLPDVPIAEDLHWSRGRRVGYVPLAPVLHSHSRRPAHLWRRTVAIHAERVKAGEKPTVGSLAGVVGALPGLVKPVVDRGPIETANHVAELVGQWWGGRTGRRRKDS